jgi:hypothetical protein
MLAPWHDRARSSLVASFANGVLRDVAAVCATITSPWSNGQTLGSDHRVQARRLPDVWTRIAQSAAGTPCRGVRGRKITKSAAEPRFGTDAHPRNCGFPGSPPSKPPTAGSPRPTSRPLTPASQSPPSFPAPPSWKTAPGSGATVCACTRTAKSATTTPSPGGATPHRRLLAVSGGTKGHRRVNCFDVPGRWASLRPPPTAPSGITNRSEQNHALHIPDNLTRQLKVWKMCRNSGIALGRSR